MASITDTTPAFTDTTFTSTQDEDENEYVLSVKTITGTVYSVTVPVLNECVEITDIINQLNTVHKFVANFLIIGQIGYKCGQCVLLTKVISCPYICAIQNTGMTE